MRQDVENELTTIGNLKARQFDAWRNERLSNGGVLMDNPFLMDAITRWTSAPQAVLTERLLTQFRSLRARYGYHDILLLDTEGRIVLGLNGVEGAMDGADRDGLVAAVQGHKPVLTDVHADGAYPFPHLNLIAPLFRGSNQNAAQLGAIVLTIDARQSLYPLLQSWPTPSASAETLMVRRDDDQVLFLNELRHQPGAALNLRTPLGYTDNIAVQTVQGKTGLIEGQDYRGKEVIATPQPVPDSPWFLISKIDKAEAFAEGRQHVNLMTAVGLGGVGLFLMIGFGAWQRREKANYKALFEIKAAQDESEERYALVLRGIDDGIWDWNLLTHDVYFSPRWKAILGYADDELPNEEASFFDRVHPDDRTTVLGAQRRQLEDHQPYQVEIRLRHRDGSYRWVFSRGHAWRDNDGQPFRFLGAITDITERKEAADLYRKILATSNDGFWLVDANTESLLDVNGAAVELSGYSREEMLKMRISDLEINHSEADASAHSEAILRQVHAIFQTRHRTCDGRIIDVEVNTSPVLGTGTFVAFLRDITEKKKSEELIWQQANFDALTGLPNRRMVYDRLKHEINKNKRNGKPLAFMLIDLDHFKEVNDSLGHEMGDVLLKEAARRMLGCVRQTDTVGRLGGDEFTIIVGELDDVNSVGRIAQSVLDSLSAPYRLGAELAYVTASIGITVYPPDVTGDVTTLLKNADQAMYAAKHQGRNGFQYFTPSMQEVANTRMSIINDLHVALQEGQFRVVYQPIVELETGAIHKAEALVRWEHPALGLVSPADFIPIAEETGFIADIGTWVFHQAATQAVRWRTLQPDFQISVNKSPVQFMNHAEKHDSWFDFLEELGLPGQSIAIEVTEGLLMETKDRITAQLSAFRKKGMQIALDDFGTGYSSLAYLKKLEIDYLKIDQSFTHNLSANSDEMVLCEAIIVMAHKLGIKVIAEGIETHGQHDLLKAMGCDYGQGYHFSNPLPAREFEKLLMLVDNRHSAPLIQSWHIQ